MDLSEDLSTLASKMSRVLKSMSGDGEIDPQEAHLASQALFFLKCWEEAGNNAKTSAEEVLGMSPIALKAATMFIVSSTLADEHWKDQTQHQLLVALFLMGVFTGIEHQERKHG